VVYKNTTLEDVVAKKDVDIFLLQPNKAKTSGTPAKAFLKDGKLWVDYAPPSDGKYAVEVPESAVVSRKRNAPRKGRFGIFVKADSVAGEQLKSLFDRKDDPTRPR